MTIATQVSLPLHDLSSLSGRILNTAIGLPLYASLSIGSVQGNKESVVCATLFAEVVG